MKNVNQMTMKVDQINGIHLISIDIEGAKYKLRREKERLKFKEEKLKSDEIEKKRKAKESLKKEKERLKKVDKPYYFFVHIFRKKKILSVKLKRK
jgi:FtsZ-binding cell division protein ZapB